MAVDLYEHPFVSGQRVAAYYPGVAAAVFHEDGDDWEGALEEALELLQKKAEAIGANAIVGVEITCDPFHLEAEESGLRVSAVGTPVTLEPLF